MASVNVAGVRSGKAKKPSLVVITVRTKPLPSPVSVTFMPGITEPPESCTVPESPQEVFWARSKADSMTSNNTVRTCISAKP